jgi:hypothetical protein
MDKPKEKTAGQQTSKKKRYNEAEIMKSFLVSGRGLMFLVDNARGNRGAGPESRSNTALKSEINNVIDYYLSWANGFPVRRTLKTSRYEFLRHLEDFCSKSEIEKLFDFLFI